MSRKAKEEYHRFFSVTDPRTHEKGYTEYKVTARFVSKKRPEDAKEVVVWKRYSELKKLHGELSYTHRNLFRRLEEFPSFPRSQVFGRFDEAVIEERRTAAEAMLLFTVNIPALYNSPQLKDFFRGGEVRRPLDSTPPPSSSPLPPPLIPLPEGFSNNGMEEEKGTEASSPQDGVGLDEPEAAVEAYNEMEDSPTSITETGASGEPENNTDSPPRAASPGSACVRRDQTESQDEFDLLFDSVAEGLPDEQPPPLSDSDLAIFDPCAKEDQPDAPHDHSELMSLLLADPHSPVGPSGEAGYLAQAANELNAAVEEEKGGEYSGAILRYKAAVDILIKGVQGDPDPQRRTSVKRRTVQYLQHVEALLSLQGPTGSKDQDT
ncbi:sorting nexin-15 isoform X1 [Brienomyrus brachyistius]|uniref:sorting nexin-15 isoform X1 n=1 Tax=Brienomyrus brachyistius TaxID=42636 RepID=UPI0020B3A8AB|nr:sorting nexin-15 isoform X1 [Brienomyrus brachyistius]